MKSKVKDKCNEMLKVLGIECALFRKEIHKTQKDVASDIGVCNSLISAFEQGKINSILPLLWYIDNGINVDSLLIRLLQKGIIISEG